MQVVSCLPKQPPACRFLPETVVVPPAPCLEPRPRELAPPPRHMSFRPSHTSRARARRPFAGQIRRAHRCFFQPSQTLISACFPSLGRRRLLPLLPDAYRYQYGNRLGLPACFFPWFARPLRSGRSGSEGHPGRSLERPSSFAGVARPGNRVGACAVCLVPPAFDRGSFVHSRQATRRWRQDPGEDRTLIRQLVRLTNHAFHRDWLAGLGWLPGSRAVFRTSPPGARWGFVRGQPRLTGGRLQVALVGFRNCCWLATPLWTSSPAAPRRRAAPHSPASYRVLVTCWSRPESSQPNTVVRPIRRPLRRALHHLASNTCVCPTHTARV